MSKRSAQLGAHNETGAGGGAVAASATSAAAKWVLDHQQPPPASLRVPPAVRCDTCGDTRQMLWAVEADPNLYQQVDDDGMVPCIDCALPPASPTPDAAA